jgi:hypothetical protein
VCIVCLMGFVRIIARLRLCLKVPNDLRESFNRGMVSLLLLLDFSKAFVKSITEDFSKSSELSVCLIMLYWFASYLCGRAQCVSVGGKFSSWLDVNSSSGLNLGTTFIFPLHQ